MDIRDLKESNDFLNILLDNITSAIFIVDDENKLQEVNEYCGLMFGKPAERFINQLCGNALGCYNTVLYGQKCGETPACKGCVLRESIQRSLCGKIPTDKEILEREFEINDKKTKKILQYSTRHIKYNTKRMVLVIVDDITIKEENSREIFALNAEINKELDIAKKIQRTIIPELLYSNKYLEIETIYEAYMKISGDFFDINDGLEDHTIIFLTDVTGHGISAALYTALLKDEFINAINHSKKTDKIMEFLNKRLNHLLPPGYYFPAIILIFDHKNGILEYSNVGSPCPVIIKKSGLVVGKKDRSGVLGLFEDNKYSEYEVWIDEIESIYIYTDGLQTLSKDDNIQEISEDIICHNIYKNNDTGDLQKIKKDVLAELPGGNFEDDITLMKITVKHN